MKKLLLLACFIPAFLTAQDQDDSTDTSTKCIKVVSIGGFAGGDFYRDGFEDRTLFQQVAPSSMLAYSDLSGFGNQTVYPYMMNAGNVSKGLMVNVHLRCQQKFGELRFGIVHTNVNISSQYYWKQDITRRDTTVLPGGEIMYTDSVSNTTLSYNWNSDMITLHLGWIVRTSPRHRFSLYTGVGVSGGIGFNGIYRAEYNRTSTLQYSSTGNGYLNYSSQFELDSSKYESFRAPMFTTFSVYVPVGINLRLGKRQNFLGHLVLFSEYQGAVQFIMPQGVDSRIRSSSTFTGGLRWYVKAPGTMPDGRRRGYGRHHKGGQQQGEQQQKVD